jgi:hypothetical protein
MPNVEPRASRPHIPGYGIPSDPEGILAWSSARKQLEKARRYWIATVTRNNSPHAMPVWGVWVDDCLYFSTGAKTRKARNLAANPRCVVCVERGIRAVIVEGLAVKTVPTKVPKEAFAAYKKKYQMPLDPKLGPIFCVRPRVAFAFVESEEYFSRTATRWKFEEVNRR